jgi:predicted DNA-binding transcriptional regulator YafY
MASATARALELLELLESGGLRTVGDLAEHLDLDERSVRRHIERLREMGIPVDATRGRYGGYRIASSYRLPPLMFSDDEAVALLVGLTVVRGREDKLSDDTALATAIAKIQRSLPPTLAARTASLIGVISGEKRPDVELDPSVLLTAADSIRTRRPVAMTYRSGSRTSQRTLQPHDLVAYGGRWYLVGLDSLSRERRTFRLDRVTSLRALAGTFPEPAPHDPVADLVRTFAAADYRYLVRLRIEASEHEIRRHLPASVAELLPLESAQNSSGWFRATIRAQELDWLPRLLLAFDQTVAIEEPEELRTAVLQQAAKLKRIALGQHRESA